MSAPKVTPAAPAEPSPATDRSDAPLVTGSKSDAQAAQKETSSLGIPGQIKILNRQGTVSTVSLVDKASKAAICCGLPEPPGGWLGPFGFFRLLSYAFAACAVFGLILALMAATGGPFYGVPIIGGEPDGFAALASLLLSFSAVVCGLAAYAHEGLANEVTAMAKQNDIFAAKNDKLQKQLTDLQGVSTRLDGLQKSMGMHMEQLSETLRQLHQVNCTTQVSTILRAFIDADRDTPDQRLEGGELADFFGSIAEDLKQAAPDFDFTALWKESQPVGIGIYNMRFLVNAVVAACEETPGKSTAMLELIMFGFNPEEYCNALAVALKAVLKKSADEIKKTIEEKKLKADPKDHGRIPGIELMDLAREVMSAEPPSASSRPTSPTSSPAKGSTQTIPKSSPAKGSLLK
eukprot:TRINITY_DN41103_c0_g1_i1.p1 TRINITY_DN41103_c0_g1~~TRINITY_DN41103_c0_g1_i1.p1  ORF type:complete len:422 (-),score=106.91 TRINITY_DN41103_c0_g1_i1:96-1310(-)